jgi:Zn-dependent metalloprotease
VAILLLALLVALLVAKSCGDNSPEVSSQEAIEIAKKQVDFAPTSVQVKNYPATLNQQRVWGVSLYTGTNTAPTRCQFVEIDADSGAVIAVRGC